MEQDQIENMEEVLSELDGTWSRLETGEQGVRLRKEPGIRSHTLQPRHIRPSSRPNLLVFLFADLQAGMQIPN